MPAIALWLPNLYVVRRSSAMTYMRALLLEPARIAALTTAGQRPVAQIWAQHHGVMNLDGTRIGRRTALHRACIRMGSMFKITQNTFRDFTLAEVLLMVAINQLEAKRKVGANEESLPDHFHFCAKAA